MNSKKKELKELAQMNDADIDYSEIPEIKSFRGWQANPHFKPIKKPVSFRMDSDLLAWFQTQPKYTHLINEACRFYMNSQSQKRDKPVSTKIKK